MGFNNEFEFANELDKGLLDLYNEQFSFNSFRYLIDSKNKQAENKISELISLFGNNDQSDDVNLQVVMDDEMKKQYKQGLLEFVKDKDGNMYAQLRNENGKFGERLTIKEEEQADYIFAAQLNAIKDVMLEMVDTLEDIEEGVKNVLSGLHNDRIGLYYSGISIYLEALQTEDNYLRLQLITQSIKSLSDAQAQIIQEFKSDLAYLKSADYKSIRKRKHDILVEKMQNIHECFQTINRIIALKAMIYLDNNQLSSMMMACMEYQKFITLIVKPNSAFLIECDPRDDKLINGIWSKRANTFIKCVEMNKQLKNRNELLIKWEEQ